MKMKNEKKEEDLVPINLMVEMRYSKMPSTRTAKNKYRFLSKYLQKISDFGFFLTAITAIM